MRISLFQFSPTSDVRENTDRVLSFMEQAASQDADLILTPEVCLSPFFPQHSGRDVAQYETRIDDDTVKSFQAACQKLKLIASPNIYLLENGKRYDASLLINTQGKLLGVSKMVHVCQAPYFYEQDYYTPSDTGFKVYDTDFGKIGIVICFDRHMPESIRTCVLRGAQIILIPTANTTREPRELFEWELRVAAMQNGVYIAMCNRVGIEDDMEFYGESIIVDPDGNIVAKAGEAEQILTADIDLSSVNEARKNRPYLALLRPETYE